MTTQSRDARGGGRPGTRRFSGRRRRQCICKEVGSVGYKDVSVLRRFISDRGRIESGRKSGNCAKCQRELSTAISRARFLALLPYAPNHLRVTGSVAPASGSAAAAEDSDEGEAASEPEEKAETEESTSTEAAEESSEETVDSSEEEAADESDETSDSVESSEDDESVAEEEDDSSDSEQSEEAEESEEEEKE